MSCDADIMGETRDRLRYAAVGRQHSQPAQHVSGHFVPAAAGCRGPSCHAFAFPVDLHSQHVRLEEVPSIIGNEPSVNVQGSQAVSVNGVVPSSSDYPSLLVTGTAWDPAMR